jgi:ubiquitin-conjugating enzyme E2 Z
MTSVVSSTPSFNKRVLKDVCKIIKGPLTDHGIHYFHSETNIMEGHALIFGPADTIYQHGVYLFHFKFPSNYPFSPPKVTYLTNDGKIRFHPNLYRNGKVCLSLLNTWKGETWTSCQNINTILLTLVTLFHNKSLLNEPGIKENHRDFKKYHKIIQYYNYSIAIVWILQKKIHYIPHFEQIIKKHFKKNSKNIIIGLEKFKKTNTDIETISTSLYNMNCNIDWNKQYENLKIVFKTNKIEF